MLLTSFLFVPLISYIFNRMLRAMGTGSLLNAEVYRIGLTVPGLVGLILISFVGVVVLYIEFGVMITIAQKTYFRKSVLVSDAIVTTVKKLPSLLGFSIFQLLFIFILIIPFIDLLGLPPLFDINLPIILTDIYYGASDFSLFLYLLLLFIAVSIFIRLLFTMHFIFIDEKTVWQGMKASFQLTKGNKLKIIVKLVLANLVIFSFGFLLMSILSFIPAITDGTWVGALIKDHLLTFSSYTMILFSLFLIPINIVILTRSFYWFRKEQGEKIEDHLPVEHDNKLTLLESRIIYFFKKRRLSLVSLLVLYVAGMFLVNYTINDNIVYLKWNVQVAAHRGDVQNAPENSMSAIWSAIEKGVDAVEFDVMMTEDGEIILNHDTTLQRVAGIPTRVDEMTYAEISKVDIGYRFSEEFIGERIPTLDQVLEEVREENVNLIVDIKVLDSSKNAELARGIVELIEKHEVEEKAYVQAFDYNVLQEVRNLNPDIKIGQILYLAAGNLSQLDVDFYTVRQTMLSDRFVENARRLDREIWVWTVNLERHMREVLKYDIDGIITSYPDRLQQVIGIDFAQEDEEEEDQQGG